jgi:lysosomal acid lipase/cholesteryl ester hydrolase
MKYVILVGMLLLLSLQIGICQQEYQPIDNIVREYGFAIERHDVTTEDGYILSLWRLTRPDQNEEPTTRPILFISHSTMYAAEQFMLHGPDLSPAMYFYNLGYDVFLNNLRGTTYSRRHQTLNPDTDREFWAINYSSFEIDQRANIQYILDLTQQEQLFVIAHALGGSAILIGMSLYPEWYQQRVITAALLGPITAISNTQAMIFQLLTQFPMMTDVMRLTSIGEMFPHNLAMRILDDVV